MSLIRYHQPYSLLQSLQDEMSKALDNSNAATSAWRPHVDIKEEANQYVIKADIPGVDPKAIKVSMEHNVLTIQGDRHSENKEEKDNYSRIERYSGSFYRQFTLPDNVNPNKIKAVGKHGVLEISIPKTERAQSRFIEVESE